MEQEQHKSKKEIELVQLTRDSLQLKTIIDNKNNLALKSIAREFCPEGRPDFELMLKSGKTSQISTFNRTYGKEVTAKVIFAMLEDLNNYFNVQRPMTTAQMTDLSIEFVEIWWFKIEEILAFSEALKRGTYGTIYERFDPSIIWDKMKLYKADRENFILEYETRFRQFDPVIVDEDEDRIRRSASNIAGAISKISNTLKPKK